MFDTELKTKVKTIFEYNLLNWVFFKSGRNYFHTFSYFFNRLRSRFLLILIKKKTKWNKKHIWNSNRLTGWTYNLEQNFFS